MTTDHVTLTTTDEAIHLTASPAEHVHLHTTTTTAGAPTGDHWRHAQLDPADTWVIHHGLGRRPAVSIEDSAGTLVHGDVTYLDEGRLVVRFAHPFAGHANLS